MVQLLGGGQFIAGAVQQSAIAGFASGAIATGSVKGALQGAFTAAVFAGVGDYINGKGIFPAAGARMAETDLSAIALHGVAGCVTSVVSGSKCGPGALSAAVSQAALTGKEEFAALGEDTFSHAALGTIASSVIGGTTSVLSGGTFANGAKTAAFGYLFNCLGHKESCASLFAKAGSVVGAGVGIAASAGCDAASGGVCVPANPEIVIASAAGGAAAGGVVGAAVDSLEKRINGNSWLSPDPTSVYVLRSNVDGSVLKFGITNLVGNETARYSFAELTALNANMTVIATFDSRAPARMLEIGLCMGYTATNGKLPPASSRC